MIDFTPLARLTVLAIAGVVVMVPLTISSAFVDIPIWLAIPAIAVPRR